MHASTSVPTSTSLLFLLCPVAFTRAVNAFHSLGYFHTSFVSRYSSILHSGTLHYQCIHDFPAGQHPWLRAVSKSCGPLPFRAIASVAPTCQGKTTRSASTSSSCICYAAPPPTAHSRDYLPLTTCTAHSSICPSDALAACAFISLRIHTLSRELTSTSIRHCRPVFAQHNHSPHTIHAHSKPALTRLSSV